MLHNDISLPPVFVRGVLLRGERVEDLPPPQTELGPGDQDDKESENWSDICHYRSFVHVALSQKFEISSVQMESNFPFVHSFSPRSQCEFLQLA